MKQANFWYHSESDWGNLFKFNHQSWSFFFIMQLHLVAMSRTVWKASFHAEPNCWAAWIAKHCNCKLFTASSEALFFIGFYKNGNFLIDSWLIAEKKKQKCLFIRKIIKCLLFGEAIFWNNIYVFDDFHMKLILLRKC